MGQRKVEELQMTLQGSKVKLLNFLRENANKEVKVTQWYAQDVMSNRKGRVIDKLEIQTPFKLDGLSGVVFKPIATPVDKRTVRVVLETVEGENRTGVDLPQETLDNYILHAHQKGLNCHVQMV